ncbi:MULTISPECIES: hypothetical protein [Spiroplasma]|uniref:hypothetical protein n=1 Tax=Spiroplasma TaxID=2132 RepID=UPI0018DC7BC1|nr:MULTISPECIES: hypothetical protein [Spiroplasma]MBH8622422.1 hypothetical protein [Spiroplasma sp. hyd1]UNF61541.1 hypothetical protein MNU24_06395 [Spiroplasma poulsonii]
MNNGFYILPNEEGYLVKSHDTNSEIALFRSRRDAEVFISTLTLSPLISPANNYSAVSAIPQYSTPPQQQVITPYPAASGASPQVFFIQQPAPAPYPYYPMMPPMPPMGMNPGMYHGIYPNHWSQNGCGGGCTCGHGGYYEHSEEDYHRKDSTEKKHQGSKRDDDLRKNADEDNDRQQSGRGFNAENVAVSNVTDIKSEPLQTAQVEPIAPVTVQEQYNSTQPIGTNELPLEQQGAESDPLGSQGFGQQGTSGEQQQNQAGAGMPDYYEQAFVANPVYVNQDVSQPQATTKPTDLNDDDFFSFINDNDFNHNSEMSKKETKRLTKEELKAAKLQAKLEKQSRKKSNRENVNDIEDLNPIVK